MDEDERKLEEIKRAFNDRIESVRTLSDMVSLIKNMSPTKVKNFIKKELQEDVDNEQDAMVVYEGKITFKQGIINEIDSM